MDHKKKLLLIGWDAFDWEIADSLMKQGKMPVLTRFLKNGVRGNLATLTPTLSPVLWTSIATGKRAYDHGISGFVEIDPITEKVVPVKSTARKVKAFWNILNEAGLKTNVVNWWPSHPPEKLNGVVVSNHFHHAPPHVDEEWAIDENTIYPANLLQDMKDLRLHPAELTLAHMLPFIPGAAKLDPEKDAVLNTCMRILAHTSSIHNASTFVMENTRWDMMAVYHESIDHFSHLAMKYHPPKLDEISGEDFELYHGIIEAAYRFHDMMLDRLLSLAGDDCDVMIVSDHGFHSGKLRSSELPDVPAAPALEHRGYGVFAAAGPSFQKAKTVYGASLLDIMPTILYLFDLPVGEDMEGKVLADAFAEKQQVSFIPSWEITGDMPGWVGELSTSSRHELEELEKIGYVKLPEEDKRNYVVRELNYNMAVSMIEGNKLGEAEKLLRKFWDDSPELRFGLLLAEVANRSGDLEKLNHILNQIETHSPEEPSVWYLRGILALQESKLAEALEYFDLLESKGVISVQLYNKIGQTLLVTGQEEKAIEYFDRALSLDENNARALSGKAHALIEVGDSQRALPLLEKSLELIYFQPNTHYLMALVAHENGYDEVALKAVEICLQQAPKHHKARKLLHKLTNKQVSSQERPVIVVTGFPRSGTSLMMQMLYQGGLSIFSDETRQQDEYNPKGYFEHEKVKDLGRNNDWLTQVRDHVLKVVTPLLRYLPATEKYRVIWMKRPLTEVILSQEVMKGKNKEEVMRNFPFQRAVEFQKEEQRIADWMERQPHFEVMEVEYYNCLHDPDKVLKEISGFLKTDLDIERAQSTVNVHLHRNKLGGK